MPPDTAIPDESWLDSRLTVRRSGIHGWGLFAAAAIRKDEPVMILGGDTMSDAEVRESLARGDRYDGIVLDLDLHLRILPSDWPGIHGNHSCEPNLWLTGLVRISTRRDLAEGEEATTDYATYTMTPDWSMACSCGTPACRDLVTGDDWRRPELQNRYAGHFAPAIARRIELPSS